jgi:hypothetical protein
VQASGLIGPTGRLTPPAIPLLLPGDAVAVSVDVDGMWPTFFDSATVEVTGVSPDGTFDTVRAVDTAWFIAIPWLLLILIAVALIGWYLYRRYRKRAAERRGRRAKVAAPGKRRAQPTGRRRSGAPQSTPVPEGVPTP